MLCLVSTKTLISTYSQPGDIVSDPFLGDGRTVWLSHIMGRIASGSDRNPLSEMLVSPKVDTPQIEEIVGKTSEIQWSGNLLDVPTGAFKNFHANTLSELSGLQKWVEDRNNTGEIDRVDKWVRMLVLEWLLERNHGSPVLYESVPEIVRYRSTALLSEIPRYKRVSNAYGRKSETLITTCEPDNLWFLPNKGVALFVTSMTNIGSRGDCQEVLWFSGLDMSNPSKNSFSTRELLSHNFWASVVREMARKLRSGGHIAFALDIQRSKIDVFREVIQDIISPLPLVLAETSPILAGEEPCGYTILLQKQY